MLSLHRFFVRAPSASPMTFAPAQVADALIVRMECYCLFSCVFCYRQVLADNVADSWMLLPVPMFFFTPSFITNIGCLYAGLVVPGLNSIKVRYSHARRVVSNANVRALWSCCSAAARYCTHGALRLVS